MLILILLVLLVDVALITWFTEGYEPHPIASLVVIGGNIALYHFFVATIDYHSLLAYTQAHGGAIIGSIVAWILIGLVWSFFKWYIYLKDNKKVQEEAYALRALRFIPSNKGVVEEREPLVYKIPAASDNKERITTWMIYWPFSILGFVLSNPIVRFYRWLYNTFSGVFDKITASVYK
jgi:hypothetical protein